MTPRAKPSRPRGKAKRPTQGASPGVELRPSRRVEMGDAENAAFGDGTGMPSPRPGETGSRTAKKAQPYNTLRATRFLYTMTSVLVVLIMLTIGLGVLLVVGSAVGGQPFGAILVLIGVALQVLILLMLVRTAEMVLILDRRTRALATEATETAEPPGASTITG